MHFERFPVGRVNSLPNHNHHKAKAERCGEPCVFDAQIYCDNQKVNFKCPGGRHDAAPELEDEPNAFAKFLTQGETRVTLNKS